MEFDKLTISLYKENINWIYAIIKEFAKEGIEKKEKFITEPYAFNNLIILGYYFLNLYVISNINNYTEDQVNTIMNAIITGASSYNQKRLNEIYHKEIDLNELVTQYNDLVKKTKEYAPNDGLKARVVAVDEIYRRLYEKFNIKHFNVFVKVFMVSFKEYEKSIKKVLDEFLKEQK